jgi:Xaa-Pro aminopeptidase
MVIEWDVPITMDDGLVLRADVFRPGGPGQYPVILTYGPYAKGLAFQEGYADQWRHMVAEHPDVAHGSSNRYQNWETVDPEKWVPDGYACVRADSRGAGHSPGFLDPFSPREAHDLYECVEWAAVREWRLTRAREAMARHGLGALLLMYDENMRYVSSTYTPGWNRLKPGLRYVVLCEGREPIVYEQGDIGIHLKAHNPWIPPGNVRHSYSWIKGAAGPASRSQVAKFTRALLADLEDAGVRDRPLGVDFIDLNMIAAFGQAGITWADGMTPMMEARAIKSVDEQKALRIVGAICDTLHYEFTQFLRPGLTENEVAAFGFSYLYNIPGMEDVEDIIVSSGPNAWPNWRNFSDRIIRPGELVIIDLAALTWNGFKSCVYRTYCVGGTPTAEMNRYYQTAHKWLWDAIDVVRPGVTTRDIALKWPSAREAWGYDEEDQAAANLWGHGLGLAQYDRPVISRIWSLDYPEEIRPGMVFALETQHGKVHEFGVRLEEMLLVTESGHELLSTYASDSIISVG